MVRATEMNPTAKMESGDLDEDVPVEEDGADALVAITSVRKVGSSNPDRDNHPATRHEKAIPIVNGKKHQKEVVSCPPPSQSHRRRRQLLRLPPASRLGNQQNPKRLRSGRLRSVSSPKRKRRNNRLPHRQQVQGLANPQLVAQQNRLGPKPMPMERPAKHHSTRTLLRASV